MRTACLLFLTPVVLLAADWSKPSEILVDETIAATYQGRYDGAGELIVKVTLAPGWHTFAMDNQIRAEEKLAGRKAIGMDRPTSMAVSGGLEVTGPWRQSALTDFSKPELRIFSWGFEREAMFAAAVKAVPGQTQARVAIKAQACTESICKNIDTFVEVPTSGIVKREDTSTLTSVRIQ